MGLPYSMKGFAQNLRNENTPMMANQGLGVAWYMHGCFCCTMALPVGGHRQQPGVHCALSHCNAPGCWKAGGIWWLEYLIQIMHPSFCKFIGFKTTLTPPLWVKGRGWRMDKTTRALAWDKPKACETSLQR